MAYYTYTAAQKALWGLKNDMKRRWGDPYLNIYRCRFCSYYHIGHKHYPRDLSDFVKERN